MDHRTVQLSPKKRTSMKILIAALTILQIFLVSLLGVYAVITRPHVADGVLQIQLDGIVAGALCVFFVINLVQHWRGR